MMPFPLNAYSVAASAMHDAEWKFAKSAEKITSGSDETAEGVVGMQLAKTQLAVNAKSLKSLDEAMGNLLDIFA